MPRYVILEHDYPERHWDLMLEAGSALRTWRLLQCPTTGADVEAQPLPDHRLHYLDYEGPISGGRGSVTRWDYGTFKSIHDATDEVIIAIDGNRLRGEARLRRSDKTWGFYVTLRPETRESPYAGPCP